MEKRNLVFILYGGAMNGAFGAGVVTALQEADIYSQIDTIYGISAGAHNAAYFLSQDTHQGATIYYEDFAGGRFIHRDKLSSLWPKLFLNLFKKQHFEAVADLDYSIKIEQTSKRLKCERIPLSKIKFLVRVFNISKNKLEYLDATRGDILLKIRASSAIMPFYPHPVKIGQNVYADSDSFVKKFDKSVEGQISKNKDKIFILVFNHPLKYRDYFKRFLVGFFWAILSAFYFKDVSIVFKKTDIFEYFRLKKILKNTNTRCIASDIYTHNFCDDQEEIYKLYQHGLAKGRAFLADNQLSK